MTPSAASDGRTCMPTSLPGQVELVPPSRGRQAPAWQTQRAVPNVTGDRCRAASPRRARPPHPELASQGSVPTEEITMRHALVTTHLLTQARAAAIAEADELQEHQARARSRSRRQRARRTRVSTLTRRTRVATPAHRARA